MPVVPNNLQSILEKYWGYTAFRPLQEQIIRSVMEGRDTLALLPTGGGKSVCYQVPALAMDGLCLVITPLVALMKDQVDDLKQKGIKALYIFSGMKAREIDIALDNAAYGGYKFLYVSPERLATELFIARAPKLNISLVAVDEAHCISQWGYDFRPSYLKIAEIRQYFPKIPVLALTATATPRVQKDIVSKLEFGKTSQVFTQSFERKNIIYSVLNEENKAGRLVRLLQMVPGTAIVYGGYRRTCKDMAMHLIQEGVSADYYHAGLDHEERSRKQEDWKEGKIRVMVCTNAFGMGIDKGDVRLVVHIDMPPSLEGYYQETGRAGRDGERAFAIAFVNMHDIEELKSGSVNHLSLPYLKRVYQSLANYLQIPEESGAGQSFDFDIGDFAKRYELVSAEAYKALKELENAGYIALSDSVFMPSRLIILVDNSQLYGFQVAHAEYEPLIKTVLRSYGGCFEEYVPINEKKLGGLLKMGTRQVIESLHQLHKSKILDYVPPKTAPQLSFVMPRMAVGDLSYSFGGLAERREAEKEKAESGVSYVQAANRCRGRVLLSYFGEEKNADCGHCDYCVKKNEGVGSEAYRTMVHNHIKDQLKSGKARMEALIESNPHIDEKQMIQTIRWMLDKEIIFQDGEQFLEIKR
jgi:ATP-dependent DNA helicase RecQ